MLINFEYLISSYGTPKGIIHIGAHELQERESYIKYNLLNTIWIEANPRVTEKLKNAIKLYETESLFNFAVTSKREKEIELNIASFDQSSSLLSLGTHKKYYPQIDFVEKVKVPAKRMDYFIEDFAIPIQNYNFINIDIQGTELQAIKSFGQYLDNIDFIYTEVNEEQLYEDCDLLKDIDIFLEERGFKQAELSMSTAKWGDAFYIRKK